MNTSKGTWVTKTGKVLKIEEMSSTHIGNCINMLNRMVARREEKWIYA